jgi:hypothetical protein
MNAEENVKEFDSALAEEYIQRALHEGRSEDEGLDDYLERELGLSRPERIDEFLRQIDEREKRSREKFLNGLINAIKTGYWPNCNIDSRGEKVHRRVTLPGKVYLF